LLRSKEPAITDVSERVEAQLAIEEQHVLPIRVESLSPADHERFGRRLRRETPWRDIAVAAVPDSFRQVAERWLPCRSASPTGMASVASSSAPGTARDPPASSRRRVIVKVAAVGWCRHPGSTGPSSTPIQHTNQHTNPRR
jgi:hypothetical protein